MKGWKAWKSFVYFCASIALLLFAVPQLEVGGGWTAPTVFAIAWIAMTLVIVAAHLHELMGVDEETRDELRQIKRMKQLQRQQWLDRRMKRAAR